MWRTKPTFGLLLEPHHRLPSTHRTDNEPSWKLAICLLLGVRSVTRDLWPTLELLTPTYSEPNAGPVFPYQIIFPLNNTAENCLSLCSTYGYPAAGMEFGNECCMWSTGADRL